MGNPCNFFNIANAVCRIVRCFHMHQSGPRRNRLFHRFQIRHIHHYGFHPEFFVKKLMEHTVNCHIADIRIDHSVSGAQQGPKKCMQSANTARQDNRIIRLMQSCDFLLQPMLVGIAVSGVHQKVSRRIVHLRKIIRQLKTVRHMKRSSECSCSRIIVCSGMNCLC